MFTEWQIDWKKVMEQDGRMITLISYCEPDSSHILVRNCFNIWNIILTVLLHMLSERTPLNWKELICLQVFRNKIYHLIKGGGLYNDREHLKRIFCSWEIIQKSKPSFLCNDPAIIKWLLPHWRSGMTTAVSVYIYDFLQIAPSSISGREKLLPFVS